MKLDFHRMGQKLFFVTFAVEGRRPVLSRLVNEKSRPQLLPMGEVVRAALRALHLVRASAGISDYVIMPDHVHFIMRVDCDRDKIASPLWLTHRVLDAVECAVRDGVGEPTGAAAPAPPPEIDPAIMARYLQAACDADDAAHGYAPLCGVGEPTVAAAPAPPLRSGGAGGIPPSVPPAPALFERSPYIELSFDSRQLKAIRRYIRLNPARKLWRLAHPDLFRRMTGLRHPFLDPHRSWSAIGDATLFASPFLFHVRLTLKKSVEEHKAAIDEIVEKARRGFIPVSGFISPGEREALQRLKAEPRARFIKLLPCALPPRYDPSAEDSRELAAGRLLILSGFSQTPALSAIEMRKNPAVAHAFRQNCLAMNDLAAALCAVANTGESQ
jgi:REP element-mobilizing transposase RayT